MVWVVPLVRKGAGAAKRIMLVVDVLTAMMGVVAMSASGKSAPAHRSPVRYVAKNIHFCVINHSRALKKISVSPADTEKDLYLVYRFDRPSLMPFWRYSL